MNPDHVKSLVDIWEISVTAKVFIGKEEVANIC